MNKTLQEELEELRLEWVMFFRKTWLYKLAKTILKKMNEAFNQTK